MKLTVLAIAAICHEANRQFTRTLDDVPVQPPWEECGADMQASAVRGVEFALDNPDAPPSAQHDAWMKERIEQGWTLGPVKDVEKKEHPALVPYSELPVGVQKKDLLFKNIVATFREAPPVRDEPSEFIAQFFSFNHLPPEKQAVSRKFADLMEQIHLLPRNPERTVALRKLLESKDAAVRASFAK